MCCVSLKSFLPALSLFQAPAEILVRNIRWRRRRRRGVWWSLGILRRTEEMSPPSCSQQCLTLCPHSAHKHRATPTQSALTGWTGSTAPHCSTTRCHHLGCSTESETGPDSTPAQRSLMWTQHSTEGARPEKQKISSSVNKKRQAGRREIFPGNVLRWLSRWWPDISSGRQQVSGGGKLSTVQDNRWRRWKGSADDGCSSASSVTLGVRCSSWCWRPRMVV